MYVIYDIECYINLFFVCTKDEKGNYETFRINERKRFIDYLESHIDTYWVGFNCARYDDIMIYLWLYSRVSDQDGLRGLTSREMREISDCIIEGKELGLRGKHLVLPDGIYDFVGDREKRLIGVKNRCRKDRYSDPTVTESSFFPAKEVDLINYISGGNENSLKMAAITLQADSIKESPIDFSSEVKKDEVKGVIDYCMKDLDQTEILFDYFKEDVAVRDHFYRDCHVDIAYLKTAPAVAEEYFLSKLPIDDEGKIDRSNLSIRVEKLIGKGKLKLTFDDPKIKETCREILSSTLSIKKNKKAKLINQHGEDYSSIVIETNDVPCTFALGGLHSISESGIWRAKEDEVILNVDVSSFYPSLISQWQIYPNQVGVKFCDKMAETFSERMAVKHDPEKQTLQKALKLAMNSIYGRFNFQFGKLYDPICTYQVTLTGQLLLIKLIDMIQTSGLKCEMIQANTDGVFFLVKKKDLEKYNPIFERWMRLSRCGLEREYFTEWYQFSVNDYFAVKLDGKVKTKGSSCNLETPVGKALGIPKAVKLAVFNYVHKGVSPLETLHRCNTEDFIMSASSSNFEQNGKELGFKKIRVIIAKNGSPITALKHDKSNKDNKWKRSKVQEGLNLVFLDTLQRHVDIDYDIYNLRAWKMIYNLYVPSNILLPGGNIGATLTGKHIENALIGYPHVDIVNELKSIFGSVLIPKNICKANYRGISQTKPETWNRYKLEDCLGFGVVTEGYIAIDVDRPENLNGRVLEMLKKYRTFTVTHGENDPLNGDKGTFIFRYNGGKIKSSNKAIDIVGFEILTGKKVVTVYGVHPDATKYHYTGNIIDLPEELETFILEVPTAKGKGRAFRAGKKRVLKGNVNEEFDFSDKEETEIIKIYKENSIDVEHIECRGINDLGSKVYELKDKDHSWVLYFNSNGTISIGTNHENFKEVLRAVDFSRIRKVPSNIKAEDLNIEDVSSEAMSDTTIAFEHEINDSIKDALIANDKESNLLVIAPTGSGKSTNIIEQAHNWIQEDKNNFAVIWSSTLNQCNQIVDSYKFRYFTETGDIARIIFHYSAGSHSHYRSGTRIVVINYSWMTRSLTKIEHSKILKDLYNDKRNILTLFDEVDQGVENMKVIQELGFRYNSEKEITRDRLSIFKSCPRRKGQLTKKGLSVEDGISMCQNCTKCANVLIREKSRGRILETQHITKPEWLSQADYQYIDIESIIESIGVLEQKHTFWKSQGDDENSFYYRNIMHDINYLKERDMIFPTKRNKKVEHNINDIMEDFIKSSYFPILISSSFDPKSKKVEEFIFPYHTCKINYLQAIDMSGFYYIMSRSKKSVMFTATISNWKIDFLKECSMKKFKSVKVTSNDYKPLDELLIIGVDIVDSGKGINVNEIWKPGMAYHKNLVGALARRGEKHVKRVMNGKKHINRSIVIMPKKPTMDEAKLFICEHPVYVDMGSNMYMCIDINDRPDALITYSRGSLSRGVNLPDFGICYTDVNAYKPVVTYTQTKERSNAAIARLEEQETLVQQSIGRIMRRPCEVINGKYKPFPNSGRKAIVIFNCDEVLLKKIGDDLKSLVKNNIELLSHQLYDANLNIGRDTNKHKNEKAFVPILDCVDRWMKEGVVVMDDEAVSDEQEKTFEKTWAKLHEVEKAKYAGKEDYDAQRKEWKASRRIVEVKKWIEKNGVTKMSKVNQKFYRVLGEEGRKLIKEYLELKKVSA